MKIIYNNTLCCENNSISREMTPVNMVFYNKLHNNWMYSLVCMTAEPSGQPLYCFHIPSWQLSGGEATDVKGLTGSDHVIDEM